MKRNWTQNKEEFINYLRRKHFWSRRRRYLWSRSRSLWSGIEPSEPQSTIDDDILYRSYFYLFCGLIDETLPYTSVALTYRWRGSVHPSFSCDACTSTVMTGRKGGGWEGKVLSVYPAKVLRLWTKDKNKYNWKKLFSYYLLEKIYAILHNRSTKDDK